MNINDQLLDRKLKMWQYHFPNVCTVQQKGKKLIYQKGPLVATEALISLHTWLLAAPSGT